jgi:phage gp36-like protein
MLDVMDAWIATAVDEAVVDAADDNAAQRRKAELRESYRLELEELQRVAEGLTARLR